MKVIVFSFQGLGTRIWNQWKSPPSNRLVKLDSRHEIQSRIFSCTKMHLLVLHLNFHDQYESAFGSYGSLCELFGMLTTGDSRGSHPSVIKTFV